MSISQAITTAFAKGENHVILETSAGRILITRKEFTSKYGGSTQTIFKAQSLEKGIQMECKASNPFVALNNLHGFVNAGGVR